jgi:hypothetical protein
MPAPSIDGVDLDHVAHAVHHWQDIWPRYMGELGAAWVSGGLSVGFAPAQIRFANDAKLEMLMPNDTADNDFLERFIVRSGPGPHHLTFKVPDLRMALEQVDRAGYHPVGINLTDPDWKEAFIHPKEATGIVVQIAQPVNEWFAPPPTESPAPTRLLEDGRPAPAASLSRIVHAVHDLGDASRLFVDLLGGRVTGEQRDADGRPCLDLAWTGPSAIRLVAPIEDEFGDGTSPDGHPNLGDWLEGRGGRLHHLELEAEEPNGLSGSYPLSALPAGVVPRAGSGDEEFWEIPANANSGLRLVIRSFT